MSNLSLPPTDQSFHPLVQRDPRAFTWPVAPLWKRAAARIFAPAYVSQEGADFNHWAPQSVDFTAYSRKWCAVKVTEGIDYVDPEWWDFASRALDAGKYVLPYHFFRCNTPGTDSQAGVDQADFHLETISAFLDVSLGVCLPPAGDFETTDGKPLANRQARINSFLDHINSVYREPLAYSSPYLWGQVAGNMVMKYKGWAAHWTSVYPFTTPTGWDPLKVGFWQYGIWNDYWWCSQPPGVTGDCDVDRALLTVEALDALAYEHAAGGWVQFLEDDVSVRNVPSDPINSQFASGILGRQMEKIGTDGDYTIVKGYVKTAKLKDV